MTGARAGDHGPAFPALPPPENVRASDGTYSDKVRVTWDTVSDASHYAVWRATSESGDKTMLGTAVRTTYDDTSATPGTTYCYWVQACNSLGCSRFSSPNTGYRQVVIPAPPTNVQASDGTYPDKVRVTWDAVPKATYYEVHGTSKIGTTRATFFDDDTGYGALPCAGDFYTVKACNEAGCSDHSSWDAGHSYEAPQAPTNVQASDGTYPDEVRVTWNSAPHAVEYAVYRATSASGPKTTLDDWIGHDTTYYDDPSAAIGTTYYYWVTATTFCGDSDYSSPDTGYRRGPIPSPPVNVEASDGTYPDKVRVTWSSSSGATYYEVYRATSSSGSRAQLGSPSGTAFDDTSGATGRTYHYWVKACNEWGCSDYSAPCTGFSSSKVHLPAVFRSHACLAADVRLDCRSLRQARMLCGGSRCRVSGHVAEHAVAGR
jgi:fibronectin type 3 domain-containing protein